MPGIKRLLISVSVLGGVMIGTLSAAATNSCVTCHARLAGNSFLGVKSHSWKGSTHQAHGVTCDRCHGGDPQAATKQKAHVGILGSSDLQSPIYYKNIPATCGKCHGAEYYKFTQSRHFRMLEGSGQGPDCVTCHGSMVTDVPAPGTLVGICERCHNRRMGVAPFVPQQAKAVLLLLRENRILLNLETQRLKPAKETAEARALRDAETALHSAVLDWHRFDLDTITSHLEAFYKALQRLPDAKPQPTDQP